MKRLLLILTAGVISLNGYSQTHADLSNNKKTASGKGFTWQFDGTSDNNCFEGGGVSYDAGVTNQTWSVGGGDLTITVPTMAAYDDTRQRAKFYSGDCAPTTIDLSATADQKLKVTLDAPMAGQMLLLFYSGTETNYSATGLNVFDLVAGANTFTETTLDLTGITDKTSIDAIGIFFRGSGGWGTYDFSGTVTINEILIGDAVVVSGTNNATIDNSLITVFPNPAKDEVNVDLARLNGKSATVKVINQYGSVVKEETTSGTSHKVSVADLEKGMYMVQVTSDNKISNKKVIVQ